MHPSEGQLRAYLDHELPLTEQAEVQTHLQGCALCQQEHAVLVQRAAQVGLLLAELAPQAKDYSLPTGAVRARLQARISEIPKEQPSMWQRLFTRQYRMAWTAAAAVLAMVVVLAVPPVRALAVDFLGLFRVQRVTVIEFNPANLPQGPGDEGQLHELLSENIQIETDGEIEPVASAAEATAAMGIPVRLPAAWDAQELRLGPKAQVDINVELEQVQVLLAAVGREDITLPAELDGVQVHVDVPRILTAAVPGTCPDLEAEEDAAQEDATEQDHEKVVDMQEADPCKVLVQMQSPTISAPPGLDVNQLGQAFLQLLGMSPEEAAGFSQSVDWATTLVLPIPVDEVRHTEVKVDGVMGTLIQEDGAGPAAEYVLVWVKDDIIYALTGEGDTAEALAIADSLR